MRNLLAIVISGSLIGVWACSHIENAPLSIQTFTAAAPAALANSHLIVGKREAILVDVVMTKSEATKLADMVKQSGRALKMIFITHAHPDHYLGLEVLREKFPQTKIVAVASVAAAIEKNGPNMVERLRARLGDEGPTQLIVPEPLTTTELDLEGTKIEMVEFREGESEHHAALYIPATRDFIAGDLIYNRVHLFLREKRIDGWLEQLETLEKMSEIKAIYPGHGAEADRAVINAMRAYLIDFTQAVKLANAAEAMQMMLKKYPDYKMLGFLEGSIQAHFPAPAKN